VRLLLDTNSLVWVSDPKKSKSLGKQAVRQIKSADVIYFSSVSMAELTVKSMMGKIKKVSAKQAIECGLLELHFTSLHAEAISNFQSLVRHDPFDRMLLAQALVEGATFLTSDRALLDLGLPYVVDATE